MTQRDYYEVLEVSKSSSGDEIKRAYRKLAIKYHPDKNPDDKQSEEKFKEASEAYQVLSNPETRQRYDQYGHAGLNGNGFSGDFSHFAEDIFGDIFGAFFGTGSSKSTRYGAKSSGRDLKYSLSITLEEAAVGVTKNIKLKRPIPCNDCSGHGTEGGVTPGDCSTCGGMGQVRIQQGFFTLSKPCHACSGSGKIIKNPCKSCKGSKTTNEDKELEIKVPAGIDNGQQLRFRGEGEQLVDGISGNLYVEIEVKEHPIFIRKDTEIICQLPITYTQAVLGAEVDVQTLWGDVKMKIPSGTNSSKIFKLKGKGIVDMSSGRIGDQHVQVYIHIPKSISDKEREILQSLAEIEGVPTREDNKSFFNKIMDLF